jgi:hypothetical protein
MNVTDRRSIAAGFCSKGRMESCGSVSRSRVFPYPSHVMLAKRQFGVPTPDLIILLSRFNC